MGDDKVKDEERVEEGRRNNISYQTWSMTSNNMLTLIIFNKSALIYLSRSRTFIFFFLYQTIFSQMSSHFMLI